MEKRRNNEIPLPLETTVQSTPPINAGEPDPRHNQEPNLKWQDALGVVGIFLAIGGMTDMPLLLRLVCFFVCAITVPLSFSSHKSWSLKVRWLGSSGVVLFMAFVSWFAMNHQEQRMPTSDDIAEKVGIREQFLRERGQPIVGMYTIVTLAREMKPEELENVAGSVEISDGMHPDRPGLLFGYCPAVKMGGYRAEVWTFPTMANAVTQPTFIDDLLLYRFDSIDRLEAGAPMKTPFETVDQLNHSAVVIKATQELIDNLSSVSIVVNDYVVFSITKSEILQWQPLLPLRAAFVVPKVDPLTGKVTELKVVKDIPLESNFEMPQDMRKLEFYMAIFSSERAQDKPDNNTTSIELDQIQPTIHHVIGTGIFPHEAGEGQMTIGPGQHGWLPKS